MVIRGYSAQLETCRSNWNMIITKEAMLVFVESVYVMPTRTIGQASHAQVQKGENVCDQKTVMTLLTRGHSRTIGNATVSLCCVYYDVPKVAYLSGRSET